MLIIGSMIRNYKILQKLGEGGMGIVYLAEDTLLERHVAIKTLSFQFAQDDQLVSRFRQEARVQASLIHPHIVALYDFFQEDTTYCMALEYARGITLKELLEKEGPLGETRALSMFGQMLQGVGYAHGKNIIHRDIKPGNIIVDDSDMIKVMDFGIAKVLGDKGMTRTGAKVGTVIYMSPEQVRAEKDIDHRTDIYSLGITLYEMLTGRAPYHETGESDFELMREIVIGEVIDPREFNPDLSHTTVELVRRCTAKNRGERFQGCNEILQFMQGTSPERWSFVEDAAAKMATPLTQREARAEEPKSTVSFSKHKTLWAALIAGLVILLGSGGFLLLRQEQRVEKFQQFTNTDTRSSRNNHDARAAEERSIADFVQNVISLSNRKDIQGLLNCYDDFTNYFGKGVVSKDFIRKDKISYFSGFDRVHYWLDGEITHFPALDSGVRKVQFRLGFSVHSARRKLTIEGIATDTLKIAMTANGLRILDEKQKNLTSRKIPD
ncbi:MAG TPA: serine/threonine-protein kinase [bacterium]|nr:serine/threonine-protein kinase [bacterium]HQG44426.1 serine/threonine-protein kinase [bacterium]HQI49712.1 serine/threonine-protein kinase [bacterium]HQJ65662.1 serine/threonine-protein kinase [bacterium]